MDYFQLLPSSMIACEFSYQNLQMEWNIKRNNSSKQNKKKNLCGV